MSLQLTLFEAVTWFLLFTSLQRCYALGTPPRRLFPPLMTGRAEHARQPRREVITTPIFRIRILSVGSQGAPAAAEPRCEPAPGGWLRHRTARVCTQARRPPPVCRTERAAYGRQRFGARATCPARCGCIPCDAHPAPSRPPCRRRENEAVTKPHGEAPPPDAGARLPLPRISLRPALPWKPPPSTPRGS